MGVDQDSREHVSLLSLQLRARLGDHITHQVMLHSHIIYSYDHITHVQLCFYYNE